MQFLQFKITEHLTILKDGRKCKNPTVWKFSSDLHPVLIDVEKIRSSYTLALVSNLNLGRAFSKSNQIKSKLSGDHFVLRIDNLTFLIARLRDSGE